MRMKQIEARDMQEALKLARSSLGESAVLLDTRKRKDGITVTFAVEDDIEHLIDDGLTDSIGFPDIPRAATAKAEIAHPVLSVLDEALIQHTIPQVLKEKLSRQLRQIRIPAGALPDVAETVLSEALNALLAFRPIGTAASIPPSRAMMLVGMHGAGKTSAIAKLATELTLHKQRVVLISCDNERMGAADNLQNLATILKCGFQTAEDRAALKPMIKEYLGQAWILIDTAGVNVYEFQQLKALGELATLQGVEPILTCPAGLDGEEAQEMAGALDFLNIERMIVTKVDAARRYGSVFSAIATGGYGIANLSGSARPAEACSPASAAALARLILRQTRERMAA